MSEINLDIFPFLHKKLDPIPEQQTVFYSQNLQPISDDHPL